MMEQSMAQTQFSEQIYKGRHFFKWGGIAMILIGIAAILHPAFFTLSLTFLIGLLFLSGGLITFFSSFAISGTGPFFGSLFLGLLQIASGFILLRNPGVGAWVMTLMVAMIFMLEGAMQLATSFEMKPAKGWGWLALSAVVSILAGFFIAGSMPLASIWIIGFLFGFNFLSTGVSFLSLSSIAKKRKV